MNIRKLLTIALLALAATGNASPKASPYFYNDKELGEIVASGTTKPIWVSHEEGGDYGYGLIFNGQDYRYFDEEGGDSQFGIYGNLRFRRLPRRRALVGEECMVNRLVTPVGVGNWSKDLGNLTDTDLNNFAQFNKVVSAGIGSDPMFSIKDRSNYYAAGTQAGFCIVASSGDVVLTLDIIKLMDIYFFRDGEKVGQKTAGEGQGGEGIKLSLIKIPGSDDASINITVQSDWVFDEIALDFGGGVDVSLGKLLKVKYAFVGDCREYPITCNDKDNYSDNNNNGYADGYEQGGLHDWNASHADNLVISKYQGWNVPVLVPFPMTDNHVKRMWDTDLDNHADIVPVLAIAYQGGAKWMVERQGNPAEECFPAGTEVGFNYTYGSGVNLGVGTWIRIILFDRQGTKVQEETVEGNVLGLALGEGGDHTNSLTSAVPFSGCEIRFHTVLGLDLGAICMHYGFVREKPDTPHHCDIRPTAESNVCEDDHHIELLHNPAIDVVWSCTEKPGDDNTSAIDPTTGMVTRLFTEGRYVFKATAADGCEDYTVVNYATYGKDAAVDKLGNINPHGCGRPMVNGLGVGSYAVSDDPHDTSGSLLSISDLKYSGNIVAQDFNSYAEYSGGLNLASNLSICGIKRTDGHHIFDSDTDQPKRCGFIVEADVTGLDLSALQFLQIRCYDATGKETYRHVISENNAVSAGIAGSDNMQKIRYSIELPPYDKPKDGNRYVVDEIQLWTSGVLNLGGSKLRIYYAFIEESDSRCSDPTGCAVMLSEETHTTLNAAASGYVDVISAARVVNNIYRFLDGNPNTCMTIANPVNAGGVTIAVNLGRIADSRHWLGIITSNETYLANVKVGGWITATTYKDGQPTGDKMTDWSVVGADVAGYGDKNFLYVKPSKPYDEVRLEIAGVVSALDIQEYYGLFLRPDLDGDGLPDCQDIESCPDVASEDEPACVGQDIMLSVDLDDYIGKIKDDTHTFAITSNENGFEALRGLEPDIDRRIVVKRKAHSVGEYTATVHDENTREIILQKPYSVRPLRTEWRANAVTDDWQSSTNWTNGTPYCCTDVVIPSDAVRYPRLKPVGTGKDDAATYCCDNIFIAPRGRLEGPTTSLNYRRAFVELEDTPNHWRMFSAPLMNVYSGDMFIPAKQVSDYFVVLDPDSCPEQRLEPAVYQRFWANTIDGGTVELDATYGNELVSKPLTVSMVDWTRPANSVAHLYGKGQGTQLWIDNGTLPADSTFRIRLPKTHGSYRYYSDYDGGPIGANKTITRSQTPGDTNDDYRSFRFIYEDGNPDAGGNATTTLWDYKYSIDGIDQPADHRVLYNKRRLPAIKLTTATDLTTDRFLLGNPFMSNIYLKPLLEANTEIEEVQFWGDNNAVLRADGLAIDNPKYIAPMDAVFLKFSSSAGEKQVDVQPEMCTRPEQPAATPSNVPQLRIDISDGSHRAAALFADCESARKPTPALLDSEVPTELAVFACNDGQAAIVAHIEDILPLGIIAADSADVSVSFRFDGFFPYDDYFFEDIATGERHMLTDDITLHNPGNTAGRYRIVHGDIYADPNAIAAPEAAKATVRLAARGGVITATADRADITAMTIYDAAGRRVANATAAARTLSATAPRGLMIVWIKTADGQTHSMKIRN